MDASPLCVLPSQLHQPIHVTTLSGELVFSSLSHLFMRKSATCSEEGDLLEMIVLSAGFEIIIIILIIKKGYVTRYT